MSGVASRRLGDLLAQLDYNEWKPTPRGIGTATTREGIDLGFLEVQRKASGVLLYRLTPQGSAYRETLSGKIWNWPQVAR